MTQIPGADHTSGECIMWSQGDTGDRSRSGQVTPAQVTSESEYYGSEQRVLNAGRYRETLSYSIVSFKL